MDITGPKISSRTMVISSVQSVNTVGATHAAVVKAFAFQHVASAQHTRAFLFAFGDIAQHVFAVREAHQWAKVGAFIEQIARANTCHALNNFLLKRGFEFRRHEHAGAVGAYPVRN